MSLHEKGDQTRALNHNSNLQTVFVWTFQIRKRLRISLPKFVEETFYPSENPVRFRRHFKTGIFGLLYLSAGGCAVFFLWASRSRFKELTFTQTVFPNSIPRGSSGILTDSRTYVDTVAYFAVANCLRNKCLAFPVDGQGHLAIDVRSL